MEVVQNRRKALRLPDYDYSQPGAYYVTVVTKQRYCLFGEVVCGEMRLNSFGRTVMECWDDLVRHYPSVQLDEFVVMPNHVHGIILLKEDLEISVGPGSASVRSERHGLPEIVRAFKSFAARRINELSATPGARVWQRNYYEHIVRNERELRLIRRYVANNPLGWDKDPENPAVQSH